MHTARKTAAGAMALIAMVATGGLLLSMRTTRQARVEMVAAEQRLLAWRAQKRDLQERLTAATARAETVESENASRARSAVAKAAPRPAAAPDPVLARLTHAQELLRTGHRVHLCPPSDLGRRQEPKGSCLDS